MTNEQQIVWLAGLLEGEGCFHYSKLKRGCHYQISLLMTDEDVVRRAAIIMGIKNVRCTARSKINPKHKDIFQIAVDGQRAIAIMKQVLPFMGQRRSAKIEEILDRYANRLTVQVAISQSNKRRASRRCLSTANLFVVNG